MDTEIKQNKELQQIIIEQNKQNKELQNKVIEICKWLKNELKKNYKNKLKINKKLCKDVITLYK